MLENSLFGTLFPYTAKRKSADMFARTESPLGAPNNGGMAGDYVTDDVSIAAPDERVNIEQIDTPNIVDDRVAIEQALPAPTEVNSPPLVPLGGKRVMGNVPTIDLDRPEFALPYPQPTSMYEQTQNALAQGQFDAQNPRNRDKGFKGALKEALQNFAFGLSHAQPGMGFWESMALGGTGLGAGLVDRSSNERREAMRNLPMLQQNAKIASDEMDASQNRLYRQKQMENIDADNKARDAKDKAALALSRRKAFSQRYKNFDPKNATPAQIRELAEFGETPDSIGKYDFGSRDSKTIGADTYKWDNNANAYVIQGNLHDKSKALTSLTFETPDQEVVTMWVPSTQAATILAQRERTGWQLRQRQELQEDAQNFRLGQKNQPTTNSANYSNPTAPKTGKTIAPTTSTQAKQTLDAIDALNATPAQKEAAKAKFYELHPNLKP